MNNKNPIRKSSAFAIVIILSSMFLGGLTACSDVDEYEIVMPEGHETYMISRQGEISMSEDFDVIFVFGHINNWSVANEITNYLNEQEPGAPFRFRRFYPDEETKGP